MNNFIIKDSGKRAKFKSGMVRDTSNDKLDPSLVRDGPMYRRWVVHLTNGAKKYAKRNWMKASGPEELARFKESLCRHFDQYIDEETDEDHAAAIFFNINGIEFVKEKILAKHAENLNHVQQLRIDVLTTNKRRSKDKKRRKR